ncbi:MAG TPA: metallophosphoesterase, partial [Myxococcota bacterium]|nr:metallophosphoesterase [Myxococcota bacterium]
MRARARAVLPFLVAFALLAAASAQARGRERIVAVGDVHGARAPLLALLHANGITDANGRWTGGRTTLVQLGDFLDRGPDERGVIELLRSLQAGARRAGGEVVVLAGNHEIMSLIGDWRYVSPEAIAGFGGAEARRRAFAPSSEVGRWLRGLPAIVELDDNVFVHGGVSPELAVLGVNGIRRRARKELARLDAERANALREGVLLADAGLDALLALKRPALAEFPGWLITHPLGPFWFRGHATQSDEELAAELPSVLKRLGAKRIVVGHTPQLPAAVRSRARGRVILADTGMLAGAFFS